ncbi:hypothetical protein F441_05895, partial [Phytophthora nicotianae CJ01A1]
FNALGTFGYLGHYFGKSEADVNDASIQAHRIRRAANVQTPLLPPR